MSKEEAVANPSAPDRQDSKDALDTPESIRTFAKPKRLTLLPTASTSDDRCSAFMPLNPLPIMISDSESNLSTDTCTSTLTEISSNTDSPFPKRKKKVSPLAKQHLSPFAKLPPKKRYKFLTDETQSSSDDNNSENASYERYLNSIKNCFDNKPVPTTSIASNMTTHQPEEPSCPLPVRSATRLSRSRSNTPVRMLQKPAGTSVKLSQVADENDASQDSNNNIQRSCDVLQKKSYKPTSIKSYFTKNAINESNRDAQTEMLKPLDNLSNASTSRKSRHASKLSLSRSRSNTPQKNPLPSTSLVKTPIPNAFQDYQEFLASLEKKVKRTKSSDTDKHEMSYEDCLTSLGVQELDTEDRAKPKKSKPAGSQSKPGTRAKRGRPKKCPPTEQITKYTVNVNFPQLTSTAEDDTGYFDFTSDPIYVADSDNDTIVYCNSVSDPDCEIINGPESGVSDTEYLDCGGENYMSAEVVNLFDNANEQYPSDYDDGEVVFSSSPTKGARARKCAVVEITHN